MTLPPLTYSQLEKFANCPKQFYHVKVARDFVERENEASIWGDRVHKAIEARMDTGVEMPDGMKQWTAIVDKVSKLPGQRHAEFKLSIDKNFQPTDWSGSWCRGIADVLVVDKEKALILDWKGLALNTKLPTPSGWTTMGEVKVGDKLFDSAGKPCSVIGKSEVKNIACYRIIFDDTTSVVCDENHLWPLHDGAVVGMSALKVGDQIRVAAPLETPSLSLPIDPYVLGLWLADGKRSSGEITKPDEFVWQEIVRRGYSLGAPSKNTSKCQQRTVLGLRTRLRQLGLLGNKHIPTIYLRASYVQRLDLLRGLMDGDGNANPARKQAVFTTTKPELSKQVFELLCSLGQRPLINHVVARGFGLTVNAQPISFRPVNLNPFMLPRKAARISPSWGSGNSWRRRIQRIEQIESVPTQCIAVDSEDHTFLCTESFLPTHNTGKRKPSDQLKLYAAMTFSNYPQVKTVFTRFVWLRDRTQTRDQMDRSEVPVFWQQFLPAVRKIEQAYESDKWPARPSGLCNGWCPVKTCTHWKEKK